MLEIEQQRFYTIKETAKLLNVSVQTLRNWDNSGFFKAVRTAGKHRRYIGKQILDQIDKMIEDSK